MENKDFIPYSEALELKQLGFDEPCLAWATLECANTIHIGNRYKVHQETDLPTKPFGVPTYSQAFRWFREKHGLSSCEFYDRGSKNGKFPIIHSYSFKILNLNNFEWYYGPVFKTYEEAELACLRLIIEIVKGETKETKELDKIESLPTPEELWLMSEEHAEKCGLQNFWDEDEIIIIRHHWSVGYAAAIKDFVNSEYKL
jgi:hypothetical protein